MAFEDDESRMPASDERSEELHTKRHPGSDVWHSRGMVFAMLFGVMGALAIPLLILSPAFTLREKWFWSIVAALYTSLLLTLTGGLIYWFWMTALEAF